MNSTTSHEYSVDDEAYIPFWVVLEFLDITPPDPFLKVKILEITNRKMFSPNGPVQCSLCSLELKPDLIAPGIPVEYLIHSSELQMWANKIANWFLSYK